MKAHLCLCFISVLLGFFSGVSKGAVDVRTYIPTKAFQYLPVVAAESRRLSPLNDSPAYYAALGEVESCLSLTHSRCWDPHSQLKTDREWGAGIGQITVAYNKDGSVRFDALSSLVKANKEELKELTWKNVLDRPDLQIRALIILFNENYQIFSDVPDKRQRFAMADSGYNGGARDVKRARISCGLAKDCDPKQWFNHVERYSPKSTKPLYGTRSAKDINLQHVREVLLVRYPKYASYYSKNNNTPPLF